MIGLVGVHFDLAYDRRDCAQNSWVSFDLGVIQHEVS